MDTYIGKMQYAWSHLRRNKVLILSLIFFMLFSVSVRLFAAPPTSPYQPGSTLNPTCAPGDTNCTVSVNRVGNVYDNATAGSILFFNSNTELAENNSALYWDETNERLGIGTSTPAVPLHIVDTAGQQLWVTRVNTNSNAPATFKGRRARGFIGSEAALQVNDAVFTFDAQGYDGDSYEGVGVIRFRIDGAVSNGITPGRLEFHTSDDTGSLQPGLTIDSNTFVGINTDNPTHQLEVIGEGTDETGGLFINRENNNLGEFYLGAGAFSPASVREYGLGVNASVLRSLYYGGEYRQGTVSADPVTFVTGATERLRIDESGNVGIGTTSPSAILDIITTTGTGNIDVLKVKSPANSKITIESTSATAFPMFDLVHPDQDWRIQLNGVNDGFKIRDKTRELDRFYIDTDGNVGIGTTAPNAKLDVDGSINLSNALRFGGTNIVRVNTSTNSIAVGDTGANISQHGVTAVGTNAGQGAGQRSTLQGYHAGFNSGSTITATGYEAGRSSGSNFSAQGFRAGYSAGSSFVAQGFDAGKHAGSRFIAIGFRSTMTDTLSSPADINDSIALGYQSDPRFHGHFLIKQANLNADPLIQGDLTSGKVGIGLSTATTAGDIPELLSVNGILALGESSSPSATTGYGKLYPKIDNNLYYLNEAGTEYQLTGSGVSNPTLADISGNSTNTAGSLYTMTSGVPVEFETSANSPLLYLDETNGRVGVGTESPESTFEVKSTASRSLFVDEFNTTGHVSVGTTSGTLYFEPASRYTVFSSSGSSNATLQVEGVTSELRLYTATNAIISTNGADLQFSPSETEQMRLTDSGNLGIGKTSPSYKLDVDGDINLPEANALKFGGTDIVRVNTTTNSIAIGDTTADITKDFITVQGSSAGEGATGDRFVAQGRLAGISAGDRFAAQGFRAGQNAGSNFTAQGFRAGESAGTNFVAQGYLTGLGAGDGFVAQGRQAGQEAGNRFIAIGYESTNTNSLLSPTGITDSIALGYQSDPRFSGHFILKQANLNADPLIQGDLTSGKVGIGLSTATAAGDIPELFSVNGIFALGETTAPSATTGYGKLYVKSSDSLLYFKDDGGTEHDLTAITSPSGSNTQLQFNNSGSFGGAKLEYSESLPTITLAATDQPTIDTDGYTLDIEASEGNGTGVDGDINFFQPNAGGGLYVTDELLLQSPATNFLYFANNGAGQIYIDQDFQLDSGNGIYRFFSGATNYGIFDFTNISGGNKTLTIPNQSGTVALTSDISWNTTANGISYDGGNVGIGVAASSATTLLVQGSGTTAATTGLLIEASDGTDHFEIKDDGTIFSYNLSSGTGGAGYDAICIDDTTDEVTINTGGDDCVTSSARFKEDITSLKQTDSLDIIHDLNPVSFTYKNNQEPRIGLIAEEVNEVDDRLVFYEKDGTTPRGVRYQDITAHLLGAVQEIDVELASIQSLDTEDEDSFSSRLLAAFKDLVVQFRGITTNEVQTERLCVGDTCVTEAELRELLESQNTTTSSSTQVQTTNEDESDESETQDDADSEDSSQQTDTEGNEEDDTQKINEEDSAESKDDETTEDEIDKQEESSTDDQQEKTESEEKEAESDNTNDTEPEEETESDDADNTEETEDTSQAQEETESEEETQQTQDNDTSATAGEEAENDSDTEDADA